MPSLDRLSLISHESTLPMVDVVPLREPNSEAALRVELVMMRVQTVQQQARIAVLERNLAAEKAEVAAHMRRIGELEHVIADMAS